MRDNLPRWRRTLGEGHWKTLEREYMLGGVLALQGKLDEALSIMEPLLPIISALIEAIQSQIATPDEDPKFQGLTHL